MSEDKDIITEPLPPSKKREKDPRRVRAGKILAEKNRLAREALKREQEREKREEIIQSISQEEGTETKTEVPWQYLIAISGVIIAGTSLFIQWKRSIITNNVSIPKVEETVQKKQNTPPMI